MKELKEYLISKHDGAIENANELEALLAKSWHEFEGDDGGMEGAKLFGRMKKVYWNRPVLSFAIARHGAVVIGGTREGIQHWRVDIDHTSAVIEKTSWRQLYVTAARVTKKEIESIAVEIADAVVNIRSDERLRWKRDGSVQVITSRVFSDASGCKQTVVGRRKRLRDTVNRILGAKGWEFVGRNVFRLMVVSEKEARRS